MRESFDEILDRCIRQLEESGGDIDRILAGYPERADELRPYLELWARLSAVEEQRATPQGAMRGRQRLLTAMAGAEPEERTAGLTASLASRGRRSMRFVAVFVAGAALALGVTFLSGGLDFGGGSTTEAQAIPDCLEALDLNGDGQLTVEDVLVFRGAIDSQDPAFDFNGDTVVDIHDAVSLVGEVVECFQNMQPPLPVP